MPSSQPFPARPLPRKLIIIGSIGIIVHLSALAVLVVAAESGPWPTPFNVASPAPEPEFIKGFGEFASRAYLRPVHLTANYHFPSNRPELPHVYFEVRLKDKDGKPITDARGNPKVFKFPEENANFWVRQRQSLLAQGLGEDQPVQLAQSVQIPSPLKTVWYAANMRGERKLEQKEERELQKMRSEQGIMMFPRPSGWSLMLAKSYARHMCRTHGAAKVEIVRHSREPILPAILLPTPPPAEMFEGSFTTLVCNFGEESGK